MLPQSKIYEASEINISLHKQVESRNFSWLSRWHFIWRTQIVSRDKDQYWKIWKDQRMQIIYSFLRYIHIFYRVPYLFFLSNVPTKRSALLWFRDNIHVWLIDGYTRNFPKWKEPHRLMKFQHAELCRRDEFKD